MQGCFTHDRAPRLEVFFLTRTTALLFFAIVAIPFSTLRWLLKRL